MLLFVCYETMEKVAAQGGLKVIIQFINVYPKNSNQITIIYILLQNFRTVELLQFSNTAQNETQDFY